MHAKILIVDDNADIVTMLEDRLQASGYETMAARDGQQALDQIAQESPHLVLLDLTLPKLSGIEVLKRLSAAKQTDSLLRNQVNHCDYAEFMEQIGARDLGELLICDGDFAMADELGLRLERTKTCMNGDGMCNFCYHVKG